MPVGLPKRLSVIALLAAGFVGYAALTLNDLLRDALPALTTLTLMWTLGVVTYPRETPRVADWLAPVMVVVMGGCLGGRGRSYLRDRKALCRSAGLRRPDVVRDGPRRSLVGQAYSAPHG